MLREPIEFQRKSRVANGTGGFIETWSALPGPSRARIKALSGSERFASDRVEATTRYRITVRYFEDLTEEDRVKIRDRHYNIRFIDNLEFRNRWLVIDLDGGAAT
jgi:SPP1 family predicted phage head-tail adaptor